MEPIRAKVINRQILTEDISGYQSGNIPLMKKDFDIYTEFYLCGTPEFMDTLFPLLTMLGYKKIYKETI